MGINACPRAFLTVAGTTGRHNVLDGMAATFRQGNNVILCQSCHLAATIDAAMPIGCFDILPLLRRQVIAWSTKFAGTAGTAVFMVALGIFV